MNHGGRDRIYGPTADTLVDTLDRELTARLGELRDRVLDEAQAELQRLRTENAALWLRLAIHEPGAALRAPVTGWQPTDEPWRPDTMHGGLADECDDGNGCMLATRAGGWGP